MKTVSYNLHFGGKTGAGNPWQQMIQEFAPDLIFAQESFHPNQYFSPDEFSQFKGCIWKNVPERPWGSAILSKSHQFEEVMLPEFEGWVVGARLPNFVIAGTPQPLLIFSIHAPSWKESYELLVNRIFDEIAKIWDETPMIVAGDFNLTTAIRHSTEESNTNGELKIIERLRHDFGLFNAWQVLHPNRNLPQTLRWAKDPQRPFHCDAIFVSDRHLAHLADANVMDSGVWGRLSDHNPIVVKFG